MSHEHILVVDDEPDIRALLREILEDEGYQVSLAEDAEQARASRRLRKPDLVLLDIWLPGTDGISLLKEWSNGSRIDVPVIMMSGHGTVETAVEATRLGAYDFIEKPLSMAKLLVTIRRALETDLLTRENIGLRYHLGALEDPIGHSKAIEHARDQGRRIAEHRTPVFIFGESGTGKELIARFIHKHSPRADGPFVSVNVAGLPRENPDIELFGSEDGGKVKFGSLEQANGGTLFIKDVADLDPGTQARFLCAIENDAYLRVGGRELVSIDVRIIAATRGDLIGDVQSGKFRDDLYYQLNVVPLTIPPLRERREDIDDIITYYLDHLVRHEGMPRREFTASARRRLRDYDWPGNVRELRNFVQRLLILGSGELIDGPEVAAALSTPQRPQGDHGGFDFDLPLREARRKFERAYLEYQLNKAAGSVTKVAEHIGVERTHLYRKLRSLDIDSKMIKKAIRG
jgi:DNA-binding NtrC family response regulator